MATGEFWLLLRRGLRGEISVCGNAGGWGLKTVSVGHCLFRILDNARKNNGSAFSGTFASRLYNRFNHCLCSGPAHVGVCQAEWRLSPGPWQSATQNGDEAIKFQHLAGIEPMLPNSLWLAFITKQQTRIDPTQSGGWGLETKFLPISASFNPEKKFILNPGTRECFSKFDKSLSTAAQRASN